MIVITYSVRYGTPGGPATASCSMDLSMGSPRTGNVPPVWARRSAEIYVRGEKPRAPSSPSAVGRRPSTRTGPGAGSPRRAPSERESEREEREKDGKREDETLASRRDVRASYAARSTFFPWATAQNRGAGYEAIAKRRVPTTSTGEEDAGHRVARAENAWTARGRSGTEPEKRPVPLRPQDGCPSHGLRRARSPVRLDDVLASQPVGARRSIVTFA